MSIIRIINGREVIPVWSIPYVCHFGVSLSAGFGDILRSLAHKPSGMIEPDFITAYLQDENGAVVPISINEWKGLLKDVNNEEVMRMETEGPLNVPYYSWRESSSIITPTQAFMYVDELSHWYYEAHKAYIDYDKNIWVIIGGKHEPIPYRREDYPLILDPIIPKKVLKKHGEWFEACNFQGQGGASPEPGQATGGEEAGNRQGQERDANTKVSMGEAIRNETLMIETPYKRSINARKGGLAKSDKYKPVKDYCFKKAQELIVSDKDKMEYKIGKLITMILGNIKSDKGMETHSGFFPKPTTLKIWLKKRAKSNPDFKLPDYLSEHGSPGNH